MANSQTNSKTDLRSTEDTRTPWQKAEYERKRSCYRQEFKNICLKHIQFLKRKEAVVDFDRLFNVWQLYIKYKKLETAAFLQSFTKQEELSSDINSFSGLLENHQQDIKKFIDLLDTQIVDLQRDLTSLKIKNSFVAECLAKFAAEFPDDPKLFDKDFVNVLQEDHPYVQIDGKLVSNLADLIRINLINNSHSLEMQIQVINGKIQELAILQLITVLEIVKRMMLQRQKEKIDLELDPTDVTYNMLQLSLLEKQELADLNTFDYRTFIQQEHLFKKLYRRSKADDSDFIAGITNKLANLREYRDNKKNKIHTEFAANKTKIDNNINKGKTTEEVAALKAQYTAWLAKINDKPITQDIILPVPPIPVGSKFGLEQARNAVIIATAQTICESLGRLALAASPRETPKSPQEFAGIFDINDAQIPDMLQKCNDDEDTVIKNLYNSRKEICQLGEEINLLIRGIE